MLKNYRVLLADPPWRFGAWSKAGKGRTAEHHYRTMMQEDLEDLGPWIIDITTANSALFMWSTNSTIPQALMLMGAWGFDYKTSAFTWLKLAKKPYRLTPANVDGYLAGNVPCVLGMGSLRGLHFGMGHYTRSQSEVCLLGIRGRMPVADRSVRQVIFAPVRQHSAKPDEQYGLIERLYPDGQRLELFARQRQPGWDVWGAEAPESIAGGPTA